MWRRTLDALAVIYLALLVAPVGPLLADPDGLVLAGGLVVGGAAGVVAVRRVDVLVNLDGLPTLLGGLLVPLVWLVPAAGVGTIPAFVFSPWAVGLGAAVVWLLGAAIAQQLRLDARIDAATVDVEFAARPPARVRRQHHVSVAILLLFALAVAGVAVLFDSDTGLDSFGWWILPMLPGLVVVLISGGRRDVAVTDDGLLVERTLHDWDTFAGYDLSEDALTLERTDWYRGTVSFDASDIDDPPALTDALDRHL